MATFALTNASVTLNTTSDISNHVKSVTISYSRAELDDTRMGMTGMARIAGLYDWKVDLEIAQDFVDNSIDEILFPLVGVQIPVKIRPDSGSASASNPEFTGNGIFFEYTPLSGAVGDYQTTSISIVCADGVPLARGTGS